MLAITLFTLAVVVITLAWVLIADAISNRRRKRRKRKGSGRSANAGDDRLSGSRSSGIALKSKTEAHVRTEAGRRENRTQVRSIIRILLTPMPDLFWNYPMRPVKAWLERLSASHMTRRSDTARRISMLVVFVITYILLAVKIGSFNPYDAVVKIPFFTWADTEAAFGSTAAFGYYFMVASALSGMVITILNLFVTGTGKGKTFSLTRLCFWLMSLWIEALCASIVYPLGVWLGENNVGEHLEDGEFAPWTIISSGWLSPVIFLIIAVSILCAFNALVKLYLELGASILAYKLMAMALPFILNNVITPAIYAFPNLPIWPFVAEYTFEILVVICFLLGELIMGVLDAVKIKGISVKGLIVKGCRFMFSPLMLCWVTMPGLMIVIKVLG